MVLMGQRPLAEVSVKGVETCPLTLVMKKIQMRAVTLEGSFKTAILGPPFFGLDLTIPVCPHGSGLCRYGSLHPFPRITVTKCQAVGGSLEGRNESPHNHEGQESQIQEPAGLVPSEAVRENRVQASTPVSGALRELLGVLGSVGAPCSCHHAPVSSYGLLVCTRVLEFPVSLGWKWLQFSLTLSSLAFTDFCLFPSLNLGNRPVLVPNFLFLHQLLSSWNFKNEKQRALAMTPHTHVFSASCFFSLSLQLGDLY